MILAMHTVQDRHRQKHWQGKIGIGYGIGYFEGLSGDNHHHQHHAHQISFSKSSEHLISIKSDQTCLTGEAFFIRANTTHQLDPDYYCSIYIDSTHYLAEQFIAQHQLNDAILPLTQDLIQILRCCFNHPNSIQSSFLKLIQSLKKPINVNTSNKKIKTLALLQSEYPHIPERHLLAQYIGVSDSRFSHWFTASFGISYRSYRKWLRLISTLKLIQLHVDLTSIAHERQFSDQAHFSRTCKQMFGINPSAIQPLDQIEMIPSLFD